MTRALGPRKIPFQLDLAYPTCYNRLQLPQENSHVGGGVAPVCGSPCLLLNGGSIEGEARE